MAQSEKPGKKTSKPKPGIYQRGKIWHIDKMYLGERIQGSCHTSDETEALEYLGIKMAEVRQMKLFGARRKRTFREAAAHYIKTKKKRSLADDVAHLLVLDGFIGELWLENVHDDTLRPFVEHRLKVDKVKKKTVNCALEVVRHILYLCAASWRENGQTWLAQAPKITMLTVDDSAKPYPLTWAEQRALFRELPQPLADMALFKVNTGTREQEVCSLRWDWERSIPGGGSVFVVPEEYVKNGKERIIVLNRVASSVIESRRGLDDTFVFIGKRGKPLRFMNNNPWKDAWIRAGLPVCAQFKRGVHNLKHTFGQRLRAAGVSEEDRQFLLGHRTRSLTTHYSAPEIRYFIDLAELACEQREEIFLRVVSHKSPTIV